MTVALSHSSDEPWCTARASPGPVLFKIVFTGFDTIARKEDHKPNEAVEGGIDKKATKTEQVLAFDEMSSPRRLVHEKNLTQ